jgi:hypothetical protein
MESREENPKKKIFLLEKKKKKVLQWSDPIPSMVVQMRLPKNVYSVTTIFHLYGFDGERRTDIDT